MAQPELIVGLGNPGPTYFDTRHNAGCWFVDGLARLNNLTFKSEARFQGEVARLSGPAGGVWLLKPHTFMNHSGRAVAALARFYKIAPEAVLIAHDELDLPPGQVRLKEGGGHGGHNGLRDTVAQLGSNAFARLRLGIGHPGPGNDVVGYVLGKPPAAERALIIGALAEALECVPALLAGDLQQVMQRLHTRNE